MRLGGNIHDKYDDPKSWVAAVRKNGYRAAYCPVGRDADEKTIRAYKRAAREADIVISEVGAWSSPIAQDEKQRKAAHEKCTTGLALADQIGARCCVNITGSRGTKWAGPHPDNFTEETFEMIVESTRKIIDEVKPTRTHYTLETMPWMHPDSVESYERLLKAIDRKGFAVHFDPVNLVCTPRAYYATGGLIEEFTKRLGQHIKSCHAKDIIIREDLTFHVDETIPGQGNLDYKAFIRALSKLDKDLPLMMEHMKKKEEFQQAGDYIRKTAKEIGVEL